MRVLARQPITFEAAGGKKVHAPLIVATLSGGANVPTVEARLVLDTGSDTHLITEEVADALALAREPGEEGTDHSGATMASWSVGSVGMSLGGFAVDLVDVVAIQAPAAFKDQGIGGILSPQQLHPSAWTVIDMVGNELMLVDGDEDEVARLIHDRAPEHVLLTLPREPGFATVVARAAIEPFPEIPTLVNSGGRGTEFSAAALPGLVPTEAGRLGAGVSGTDVTGSLVGARTLLLGGRRIAVEALAVRSEMHDPQGMVGMDVLRRCVLACSFDPSRPTLLAIEHRVN
ncbi:MAG TPA: aspartyl protease family protein [Candidatus Limnocylindrales bacterium]|nr:aspartyl protease family protein [Candidatus Limnocylindrales bacterium]